MDGAAVPHERRGFGVQAGSLHPVFDVRPGEGRVAVLGFAAVLLLIIAAHTIFETARDTLLLTGPGPRALGLAYMGVASCTFPAAALAARAGVRFGSWRVLLGSLAVAAVLSVGLFVLPTSGVSAVTTYVVSGVLGSVLVPQFWILVGTALTVAQGRRLFGLIAAAGIVGGVVGSGSATAALLVVPVRALLLVSAAVFVAAVAALARLRAFDRWPPARTNRPAPVTTSIRTLREEPFLLRVALVVLLSTATLLTIDYLFKSTVARTLPPGQVAPFIARFHLALNVLSLIVQVFVGSAIVQRFGTLTAVVLTPASLLVGAIGAVLSGGGALAVFLVKGVDGSLRHSIHRITGELVYLPVSPVARQQAKPLIDGALARVAQTVTGALLFVLAGSWVMSPRVLSGLIVLLAGSWFVAAVTMHRPYLALLRRAVSAGALDAQDNPEPLDLESAELLVQLVASQDPREVIAALHALARRGRGGLISALVLLYRDDSVLTEALAIFAASPRIDWIPLARRLLDEPSEAIRIAAARALAAHGAFEAARYEHDPSPRICAYSAVHLALAGEGDVGSDPRVARWLAQTGEAAEAVRLGLLAAIADSVKTARLSLLLLALSEHPRGRAEATELLAHAAARQQDPRLIAPLIDLLSAREGREAVRAALVALGEPALRQADQVLCDPMRPRSLRVHMPKTLARFGTRAAAYRLLASLETGRDGLVRYKCIRALGAIVVQHGVRVERSRVERLAHANLLEYFRILGWRVALESAHVRGVRPTVAERLLLGLLQDKLHQSLDRAFRLLKIAHPAEDFHRVYLASVSKDPYVKANAGEFLDAKLRHRDQQAMRALLEIIADDLAPQERMARALSALPSDFAPRTSDDALVEMVRDPDVMVAALAGVRALEVGSPALHAAVAEVRLRRPEVGFDANGHFASVVLTAEAVHG